MSEALEITGLRKSYGPVEVLRGVDLHARAGEIHALLGENGAGKSTLIKVLSGVTGAGAGTVTLGGRRLTLGRPTASTAAGVRTVFQELSTIPQLTVAENLLYGAEPLTPWGLVSGRRLRAQARELLARYGLARIDVTRPLGELALGDRQLLEVVKALREQPKVLVLDEATSALSSEDSAWVLEQGRRAADNGAVVLLITHRLAEMRAHAERLTVLRGGESVLSGATADFTDDELIVGMLGRRLEVLYPQRSGAPGDALLEASGLAVGDRIGPLDLTVRRGEVLGIGGLQGQGQRELLMALGGACGSRGSVRLSGSPYAASSPKAALAAGVALVPEDRQREGLFLQQQVRDNITIASLRALTRPGGLLDAGKAEAAAREQAVQVGVATDRLGTVVSALSGGNQQKVVLGKALLARPSVLLLHDCTRGVDVGTKADIFALIAELADRGVAVVFYSSDLSELVHVCDRVAVMAEGRIVGEVAADALTEQAILRLAVGVTPTRTEVAA
ncbi:sugar ABC transporter ATP-binding protein [Conexibacter sp. JD483]|uniref:sugar ABC transporter ATP-binding protein n=1 Tax=unclassified Conexibacter TaxID=2627773 RepID=UPI00271BCD2F|nr:MULTISPECIES: sugar ABC transporter ATP-binding protein [unclassified Conexibacter]MDO8187365.1 sugar ABC transporter ATP-binding protein [Conexibacter sp. CPCC 205706]MDO8200502.1 sugar ABC transporter ATP-binding protein [Conexibacter sp. CPCC 205762]MDR9371776.1 sugar ABC transporter ATP-binding protein [Conexibacter sp. JD483]